MSSIPTRPLGRTGHQATLFGLGGEGVLRTHGRMADAVAVIERALDLGVNYCDTAPAYSSSMDYYGAALSGRRGQVFLASKTADREVAEKVGWAESSSPTFTNFCPILVGLEDSAHPTILNRTPKQPDGS